MFKLSSSPIESQNISKSLIDDKAGAFNCFEGWVRNHNEGQNVIALEYEAHESLCSKEAERVFTEARQQFDIIDLVCVHRVGRLEIGDMAVWVGVIAAHRDDSFKACRYIIDEIKKRLPIWKKEFYTTGDSGWINCEQPKANDQQPATSNEQQFYSRQTILSEVGIEGQAKLKATKVLVVGAGGLGCSALTSLTSAGVGTIGICEYDKLDASNLHRQSLYSHSEIGQPKIELAEQRLKAINPFITIEKFSYKIDSSNAEQIIDSYDYVVDCTDNFKTKFLLNDACVLLKKILIQSSIYQYEGQLRTIVPHQTACLRCLWPEVPREGCVGTCVEAGVLGAVPALFGNLQAMEVLKLILGLAQPHGDTLLWNLQTNTTQRIKQKPTPSCPVCGDLPTITDMTNRISDEDNAMEIQFSEIKPDELGNYYFIDIREPMETMMEPVKELETIKLPLSQFEDSDFKFESDKKYIIFCAKGVRSYNLTEHLHEQGVTNTQSLAGGVDAIKWYFDEIVSQ